LSQAARSVARGPKATGFSPSWAAICAISAAPGRSPGWATEPLDLREEDEEVLALFFAGAAALEAACPGT